MADITNAEAIRFCNEKVRVMADQLESVKRTADALAAYWAANPQLATAIPNDDSPIKDGANPASGTADGRQQIVGSDVHNIINRASEVASADLTRAAAPLWDAFSWNTILSVAVNGKPRF